jgi:hypothetical protein
VDGLAGGAFAQVQAVAQPAGGGGGRLTVVVVGAGGAAAVDGGQFLEPVAFQAVQQPPQRQHPRGRDPIGQPGQVLAGQPLDGGFQPVQPDRLYHDLLGRMCVRIHGQHLPGPPPNSKHPAEILDNYFSRNSLHMEARQPPEQPGASPGLGV